jgi:3-oxoacyl-[acyl-carrier protein] reductase
MVQVFGSLKGRTALVTGSRRGIGKAIALSFAGAGANVVVTDIVTEDGLLDSTAKQINKIGQHALSVKADVTQKADVDNLVRLALSEFGKIDILVNCAGKWIPGESLLDYPETKWEDVLTTNLKSTFLCCQAVAKTMVEKKGGNIINLASDLGITPVKGIGSYGVAKAAIILLTKQLSLELSEYHIRVNAIAPGMVKTDMNIALRTSPEVERKIAAKMVIGRLAEPADISDAALFLASNKSDYINGQVIVVNGGGTVVPPLVE